MADSSDVPSSPFESHHRSALARLAPFAAVAIVAELSLALPPGPASSPDTYVSVLFLALTAAALMLPKKASRWVDLMAPLLYTGSCLALILAAGGSSSAWAS